MRGVVARRRVVGIQNLEGPRSDDFSRPFPPQTPGGVHPLARAAASGIDADVRPIAVTGLHRDDEHRAEALSIARRRTCQVCA
jgi:hypothetical protein